jgi:hypothetical protein
MLSEKQILEIGRHLEKAENPVFFFDHDCDGLCSFLLARRFTKKGEGFVVRGDDRALPESLARKAEGADVAFVFDVFSLSQVFVDKLGEMGVKIVWVDHHPDAVLGYDGDPEHLHMYKPEHVEGKQQPPVSWEMYNVVGGDEWVSIMGCLADHYLPEFSGVLGEAFPDFWSEDEVKKPFDGYYGTEIGELSQLLGYGLHASDVEVKEMLEFLVGAAGPEEVLEKSEQMGWRKVAERLKEKIQEFVADAKEAQSGGLIFLVREGSIGLSGMVSNRLMWELPKVYAAIGHVKSDDRVSFSMRGNGIKKVLESVLKDLGCGKGGGHPDAVGAMIPRDRVKDFEELLRKEVGG